MDVGNKPMQRHRQRNRVPGLSAPTLVLILGSLLCCAAQNGAPASNDRNAILRAKLRLLGQDVTPFTSQKQNAVIVGVSNAIGGGVLASDVILTVYNTYDSITATAGRKLLQGQTAFPGVDIGLNITTSQAEAEDQANTLRTASNETYQLASQIGAQGLQTQQIILQSTDVVPRNQTTPPPSPAPSPPPPSPSPAAPPPSPPPPSPRPQSPTPSPPSEAPRSATPTSSPTPASTPTPSGTASTNAAGASTGSGSSLSTGAIIGIAVGAAAVVLVAALVLVVMRRRRSKYTQQGEVIDYFSDLGKHGSRDVASGGLPVTASSNEARSSAGQAGHHRAGTSEKVEVPVTDKAEIPKK